MIAASFQDSDIKYSCFLLVFKLVNGPLPLTLTNYYELIYLNAFGGFEIIAVIAIEFLMSLFIKVSSSFNLCPFDMT